MNNRIFWLNQSKDLLNDEFITDWVTFLLYKSLGGDTFFIPKISNMGWVENHYYFFKCGVQRGGRVRHKENKLSRNRDGYESTKDKGGKRGRYFKEIKSFHVIVKR